MDAADQNIQLACINVGDDRFAVDIMRIREIILPQRLSALPGGSQTLEGVINLRGTVIPVMDLRKRLGLPPAVKASPPGKLLIVSLARQRLALAVDNVSEVITIPAGELLPVPDTAECVGLEYLLGICLHDEQVFMILDVDSLLGQLDLRPVVPASAENEP